MLLGAWYVIKKDKIRKKLFIFAVFLGFFVVGLPARVLKQGLGRVREGNSLYGCSFLINQHSALLPVCHR